MKIINLVVGSVLIWLGGDKIASAHADFLGWLLLVIGIVIVLSAFNGSSSGSGGDDGFFDWGGSDGGSGDGGGD